MPTRFLTPKEAAAHLKLSTGYVRRLILEGRIKAYKPTGRKILIDADELDAFIKATPTVE